MKKIVLLIVSIFALGCSIENDENTNRDNSRTNTEENPSKAQ